MSLIVTHLTGGQTTANIALQHFGAILTGSGIVTPTSFSVTQQVSPGMSVLVSGSENDDKAVIITPSGDTYFIKNLQDESITILTNSSGVTKTDAIVLYVDLTDGDPDNAGSPGAAKLLAVRRDGVSTGAPTDGEIDAATNNNPWLKLREVTVEHDTGEIEDEDLSYEAPIAYIAKEHVEPIGSDQVGFTLSDWSPTITGNGSMTVGAVNVFFAKYVQLGELTYISISASFTTSGSANSTVLVGGLPVPANPVSAGRGALSCHVIANSGSSQAGLVFFNSATQLGVRGYDSTNWEINSSREIRISGFYPTQP